jgi:hypothetical protein
MQYLRQLLLAQGVLAVALITLLPATAATTRSVIGVLKDATGTPIAGGTVILVDKARGKSLTAASERKGSYGFRAVLPRTYQVYAEAPDSPYKTVPL